MENQLEYVIVTKSGYVIQSFNTRNSALETLEKKRSQDIPCSLFIRRITYTKIK